jgi:hypothetical protein
MWRSYRWYPETPSGCMRSSALAPDGRRATA